MSLCMVLQGTKSLPSTNTNDKPFPFLFFTHTLGNVGRDFSVPVWVDGKPITSAAKLSVFGQNGIELPASGAFFSVHEEESCLSTLPTSRFSDGHDDRRFRTKKFEKLRTETKVKRSSLISKLHPPFRLLEVAPKMLSYWPRYACMCSPINWGGISNTATWSSADPHIRSLLWVLWL